jgi:hypothetical protein
MPFESELIVSKYDAKKRVLTPPKNNPGEDDPGL